MSACATHVSKVGPFVRNISMQPQGMVVDSCVVQYEVTHRFVTMPWQENRESEVTEGVCFRTVQPMGGIQ